MRRYIDILNENAQNAMAFIGELRTIQAADPKFWDQVYLMVTPNDYEPGDVTIDSMEVKHQDIEKGKGKGRQMLKILIDLADKHHVMLRLEAHEDSASSDFLENWYQRAGFEGTGEWGEYGPVMIRKPW